MANRHPNGDHLTADDLRQIAKDAGFSDKQISKVNSLHNTNLIFSALWDMTMAARFDMMNQGKLVLDTRTPNNSNVKA